MLTPPEIAASVVGGQSKLADRLGCTRQRVSAWCKDGKIPRVHLAKVSEVTKLPLEVLAPDIFKIKKPVEETLRKD